MTQVPPTATVPQILNHCITYQSFFNSKEKIAEHLFAVFSEFGYTIRFLINNLTEFYSYLCTQIKQFNK